MPLPLRTKFTNEHLIFLKNVPTYVSKEAISDIYDQYGANGMKSIYPNGPLTTIVVAFHKKQDAVVAQQETDGMKLENVIVRVEMQKSRRSFRLSRSVGPTNGRAGGTKFEDNQSTFSEVCSQYQTLGTDVDYKTAPEATLSAPTPNFSTEVSVWPQLIPRQNASATMPPSDASKYISPQSASIPSATPAATPRVQIAIPNKLFAPQATEAYATKSESPIVSEAASESTIVAHPIAENTQTSSEDKKESVIKGFPEHIKEKKSVPFPEAENFGSSQANVGVWDPIDTTERIRQRHRQNCAFCRKRNL